MITKVQFKFHDENWGFLFLSFSIRKDRLMITMSDCIFVEYSSEHRECFNFSREAWCSGSKMEEYNFKINTYLNCSIYHINRMGVQCTYLVLRFNWSISVHTSWNIFSSWCSGNRKFPASKMMINADVVTVQPGNCIYQSIMFRLSWRKFAWGKRHSLKSYISIYGCGRAAVRCHFVQYYQKVQFLNIVWINLQRSENRNVSEFLPEEVKEHIANILRMILQSL